MNCGTDGVNNSVSQVSCHRNSVLETKNAKKEAFLDVIHNVLDVETRVNDGVFEPVLRALLKGCDVLSWEEIKGESNTFSLTLNCAYEAVDEKSWFIKGKTFFIEKEIMMGLDPENFKITFPKVKALYDAAPGSKDPEKEKYVPLEEGLVKKKNLNSFWAVDSFGGIEYTGVAYSIRWNRQQEIKASYLDEVLIIENINDAPESLQFMATPRIKTVKESMEEWNSRSRKPVNL